MGVLAVNGTRLEMDGQPFYFQGLSFFNALYNPRSKVDDTQRRRWGFRMLNSASSTGRSLNTCALWRRPKSARHSA